MSKAITPPILYWASGGMADTQVLGTCSSEVRVQVSPRPPVKATNTGEIFVAQVVALRKKCCTIGKVVYW